MNDETCDMEGQAVAYGLHALEPDEEAAFEQHLPGCAACQEMVAETERIAGDIGAAVPQLDPPERLRDSIVELAERTPQIRQTPPVPPTPRPPAREEQPPAARRPPQRQDERRPATRGPRRRRIVAVALAAAAVLAFGGLGAYTAVVQQQRDAQAAQVQAMAEAIVGLVSTPTTHATLHSSQGGHAVAAVIAAQSGPIVVGPGLQPNGGDTTYVLWGIAGDPAGAAPEPLGAFDVTREQPMQALHSEHPLHYTAYAISLEPGRVPPTTPTELVAQGPVAQ
ncbi:anti-sigma factor [Pseudonocardia sp. TRM90224]|uniref:anti-sigma factor n=1 Tax=Pseudonocardia sp. TRM90224 TaxID=2812678 RepID=UPI001E3BD9EF|nr:anti-sigma factor [Pseudonocardia sp. TRM90224]